MAAQYKKVPLSNQNDFYHLNHWQNKQRQYRIFCFSLPVNTEWLGLDVIFHGIRKSKGLQMIEFLQHRTSTRAISSESTCITLNHIILTYYVVSLLLRIMLLNFSKLNNCTEGKLHNKVSGNVWKISFLSCKTKSNNIICFHGTNLT